MTMTNNTYTLLCSINFHILRQTMCVSSNCMCLQINARTPTISCFNNDDTNSSITKHLYIRSMYLRSKTKAPIHVASIFVFSAIALPCLGRIP